MRRTKPHITDSARNAVLGYLTVVLSFAVLFIILWAVMTLTRVVVG